MTEIEKIKKDICLKILRITNKEIMENNINILGKPYYLEPRSLVYLFMEIQQDYNIDISEEQLKNQQFATINGISSIIMKCLGKED